MARLLPVVFLCLGAQCAALPTCSGHACEAPDLPQDDAALLQLRSKTADSIGASPSPAPVVCPGSGVMCAGDQCCPRSSVSNDKTFPCPNANPNFNKCEGFLPNPSVDKLADYYSKMTPWVDNGGSSPCYIGPDESCPVAEMDGPTRVYPGGQTSCLEGEYGFLVSPGDPDKLLFNFQGGGACWSALSYNVGLCVADLSKAWGQNTPLQGTGIFNRSEPNNAFRNYTFVFATYCSGDAFIGDTTQQWDLVPWRKQEQRGYQNTLAVVEWTQANTPRQLRSLVVAGQSAGALGTQAWARLLLGEKFQYEEATVIVDSYTGIFPEGTVVPTLKTFNACDLPVFDEVEQLACNSGNFTIPLMVKRRIEEFPSVPFGYIQSKRDFVQTAFWDAVYATYNFPPKAISDPEFYLQVNQFYQQYNLYGNFVAFLVDGFTHTFTQVPNYYVAGTKGTGSDTGQLSMTEWVNTFLAGNCPGTECYGPSEPLNLEGAEYCYTAIIGKECTAH